MNLHPPSSGTPSARSGGRRGVLLLVVLSMLTLFMLLGVTYLVLAARVRSTSRAFLKLADDQAQTAVTFTPLLKDAALQVMRGTQNSRSAIRFHDLLADKYGGSQICGVSGRTLVAGGQMLAVQLASWSGGPPTGRVVTYLSGPDGVRNTSGRIVAWDASSGTIYMARPRRLAAGGLSSITSVLVNGRDFSGTGFSSAGAGTLNDSSLAPNQSVLSDGSFDATQANEDYDAFDEQNMALAVADGSVRSFERRQILDFWIRDFARNPSNGASSGSAAAAKARLAQLAQSMPAADELKPFRRATLRPFAFDHYQDYPGGTDFTGKSLGSFDVIAANPGDVDNDGDGSLDSIWLDLGYAATYLSSDRKYVKPLFAIHCVDLGGRVNINAHGSAAHAAETSIVGDPAFAPTRADSGAKTPPTWLRGGLGFGPADVRLDAVVGAANVGAVMFGSDSVSGTGDGIRRDLGAIVGRYGDGVTNASAPARPGRPAVNDRRTGAATLWTDRGLPEDFWTRGSGASLFGASPPDFWSRLSVGVDHRGHPYHANRAAGLTLQETTDNPYEFDLSKAKPGNAYAQATADAWVDQPFTAAELEAVLRPYDLDNASALPPRGLAVALAAGNRSLTQNRMHVTTESWDTPAVISQDFTAGANQDPDLVEGLKMDLNRPFGDAFDNDTNGLVDEPGETGDTYANQYGSGWLLTRGQFPPHDQPGPNEPHLRARQLYAYHLFTLVEGLRGMFAARTATDPGLRLFAATGDQDDGSAPPTAKDPALNDSTPSTAVGLQEDHIRRVLAQWCVNVVDFLDADAIMTPFRYRAGTGNQYVVWGCEYPDMMVTETLAFHDRRTADTPNDNASQKTTQDFKNTYQSRYDAWMNWKRAGRIGAEPTYPTAFGDDDDFDQVRVPEGSLFLELFGTRNPNTPNMPKELYTYDTQTNQWFLDLGRVPSGGTEPVWRLSISDNQANSPGNDVFARLAANPDTEWLSPGPSQALVAESISIERYVWFSRSAPTNVNAGPTRDNTFYLKEGAIGAWLKPGGYLVVGPRQTTAVGAISGGSGTQKWGVPSEQRIVLNGGTAAEGSPAVGVYDLAGQPNPSVSVPGNAIFRNPLPPPGGRSETTATWVAMDRPTSWTGNAGTAGIGLNVSEPLRSSYYTAPTHRNPANGLYDAYGPLTEGTYTSYPDMPLDRGGGCPLANQLLSLGTFANFCTVFVERLADPTRPHQPDPTNSGWNPYVVVDFMPIDLTVFNGESSTADPSETQGLDRGLDAQLPYQTQGRPTVPLTSADGDPLDPAWMPLPFADSSHLRARHTYFHTRQRGFGKDLPNYDNDGTLFGLGAVKRNPHPFKQLASLDDIARTPDRTATAADRLPGGKATTPRNAGGLTAAQTACFLHELGQGPDSRSGSGWSKVPFHSLGWVNPSYGRRLDAADGVPAAYYGAPDRPFPWIVWNDRPFANPWELALVPRTPPGRLFSNYRNPDYPGGSDYSNTGNSTYNTDDLFAACIPAAHLLPITSITDVPASGATRSRNADLFARLFEYVRVRSPFTGTETVLTGLGGDGRPDRFVGPFNRLPTYREPGRININTIHPDPTVGGPVWNAACGVETGDATPSYATIVDARTIPLPAAGTYFRPYRVARGSQGTNALLAASWLTNPPGDSSSWLVSPDAFPAGDDRFSVRSFTLLGDKPRTDATNGRRDLLFPPPAADAWANDAGRNAWFRFESLIRANANATVRSEVYAIWVTMGLFEVTSAGTSWRYPDGWRLVREYGSDTGDVTRHRGFYIFDRSIPMGFQQGSDLNVQDGILVERFIE